VDVPGCAVSNVSKAYSRTCRSGLSSLFRNGEPRELVAPRDILRTPLQVFWLTSFSGLFHALLHAVWLTLWKRLGGAIVVSRLGTDKNNGLFDRRNTQAACDGPINLDDSLRAPLSVGMPFGNAARGEVSIRLIRLTSPRALVTRMSPELRALASLWPRHILEPVGIQLRHGSRPVAEVLGHYGPERPF
jgi:hypothetical protein